MASVERIQLPLRHIGSVNAWLLRGDPLTLIDAGPRNPQALAALEEGLRAHDVRLEDLELVLATHHHLDHVGLLETIRRRSGARVAVLDALADYGTAYAERSSWEREFSQALMAEHGVPPAVIADNESFWRYISDNSEGFGSDVRLVEGDVITAGGRDLRVVAHPGHSTTDTLFVDDERDIAFVGDHVLGRISSNTEIYPGPDDVSSRPQSRGSYLDSLRKTAEMRLRRLYTGHGAIVTAHADLVRARLREHEARSRRIAAVLARGPNNAYGIAGELWPARLVREQPLLVIWEVLGHVDLMLAAGELSESTGDDGQVSFAPSAVAA
jgi:glyoxylase-like metal-dependent hydrolase (beta-lactamase superfamily II)